MGQTVDEGDALMRSAPPKIIERVLSLIIPPACREEVLGDLYEGSNSTAQYVRQAVRIVPMVIFSRIRRTADSQVLLMHATALYMSFLVAAWYQGKTFLFEKSGLLRLAIPPAWVLFGLIVDEAYASLGKRSILKRIRGPVLGLGFAYLSHMALVADDPVLALPMRVMFFGSAAGLLLSTGLKLLFPPVVDRPAGAGGPALWLKHTAAPFRVTREVLLIVKALLIVLLLSFVGGEMGGRWLTVAIVFIAVLLLMFRELPRGR